MAVNVTLLRQLNFIEQEGDIDSMTEWEQDFIANVGPKIRAGEWMTEKQIDAMERVYENVYRRANRD